MEDLQKQHTDDSVPRRRRAVRAVPMSAAQERTGSAVPQNADVHPIQQTKAAAPAVKQNTADPDIPASAAAQHPKRSSDEIDAAFAEELNRAFFTAQIPTVEEIPIPDAPKPAEEPSVHTSHTLQEQSVGAAVDVSLTGEAAEVVQQERVRSAEEQAGTASVQRSLRPTWIALGAVLMVLLLSAALVIPFLGRTEAVMLYINDTAVGYLAHEDIASEQMARVQEELRTDAVLQPDVMLYRCETEQVRGEIGYLSSDDVYDALLTQATDGYVRAYCIDREIGDMKFERIGVLTEAEIFAARDAVISYFTELYTPNLPAEASLSVYPGPSNFRMWGPAWIPESSLMDTVELTDALIGMQDSVCPMFEIRAYMTETEAERIPYETTLVPNDENFDGIRTMISAGADGLAQVTYQVTLDPATGAVLERKETSRVVVREPVSAVSYEGLYPLPDGVSTGTFDWPLPALPDDEMPTDENGNPMPPENPLALKNTYVSSGYGERDLWGEEDFHLGLDIVAPAYTEIYAADGGVVVFAAHTSSYGYMTRIRHANNVETVYAHQIKLAVKAGDVVEKGQLIGYVGSTGNSSGSHLHLEFRRDHVTVDPLEYIEIPEDVLVIGEGY